MHAPRRASLATAVAGVVLLTATLTACSADAGQIDDDCTPTHEFSTIKDGALTVVLYDLPPYSKLSGNTVTGVDGDVITAFADEQCLTISGSAAATAANIPAVQAGRADVSIAAWYRTQARAEIVGLTEPIYLDQMAIISSSGASTVSELEGQVVGTVDGYLWTDDLRQILGENLRIYPTPLNLYQDLEAGRISLAVDSFGSATYNNDDGQYSVAVVEPDERVAASIEAAQIAIPVTPGNDELLAALNDFIEQIREDGRLGQILVDNGLDATAADTGPARLI